MKNCIALTAIVVILANALHAEPEILYSAYDPATKCSQIFGCEGDGSGEMCLTTDGTAQHGFPHFSHNGLYIYYYKFNNVVTNSGLWRMTTTGGSPQQILPFGTDFNANPYGEEHNGEYFSWPLQSCVAFAPDDVALVCVTSTWEYGWGSCYSRNDHDTDTVAVVTFGTGVSRKLFDVNSDYSRGIVGLSWPEPNKILYMAINYSYAYGTGSFVVMSCDTNGSNKTTICTVMETGLWQKCPVSFSEDGTLFGYINNGVISIYRTADGTLVRKLRSSPGRNKEFLSIDAYDSNVVFTAEALVHKVNIYSENYKSLLSQGPMRWGGTSARFVPEPASFTFLVVFLASLRVFHGKRP